MDDASTEQYGSLVLVSKHSYESVLRKKCTKSYVDTVFGGLRGAQSTVYSAGRTVQQTSCFSSELEAKFTSGAA